MSTDEHQEALDKILNTIHVAETVTAALREDRAQELTGRDLVHALTKPDTRP